MDTVYKITGHQTASIVAKHYFHPEREQLKIAMQKSLPSLLTSSSRPFTPSEKAAKVLRSADSSNWEDRIAKALILPKTAKSIT